MNVYVDADWLEPGRPVRVLHALTDEHAAAAMRYAAAAAVARAGEGPVNVLGHGLLAALARDHLGAERCWDGAGSPTACLCFGTDQAELDAALTRLPTGGLAVLAGARWSPAVDLYDFHRRDLTLVGMALPEEPADATEIHGSAPIPPPQPLESAARDAPSLWYVTRSRGTTAGLSRWRDISR